MTTVSINNNKNNNILFSTGKSVNGKDTNKKVRLTKKISEDSDSESNAEVKRKRIRTPRCRRCRTILVLINAAILFLLGLLTLRFTLFEMLMQERLRMRPGLLPFDWWKNPEPEVRCKIFIFTVTNHESYLNRTDSKMKIKEFGPIIYQEYLKHTDVVLHENSTMSYTIERYLKFRPDLNEPGILNKTVTVPNIVLLGMVTHLANYNFGIKMAFNFMSRNDRVFVNSTVYNYLWNFTTPAFLSAREIVPFMVHQDNGGPLHNVYASFKDRVNVRMGTKYGYDQFFMINSFNGRPTVPGFIPERGDCFASVQNSSEGALYPNFLTKKSKLNYWRKTVCRPITLSFEKEVWKGSILGYKYIATEDLYDRFNSTEDCYSGTGDVALPDGLSDISRCYNDLPMAVSSPHFYGRTGYWSEFSEGFAPSKEKHGSYAILEPKTGVPVEQVARSQSNLVMPKLSFFHEDVNRFSEAIVPMIWIEYHQEKLTTAITAMLIFTVNVLPILQYFISAFLLIGSGFFLYTGIKRLESERRVRHLQEAEEEARQHSFKPNLTNA